LSQIFPAPEKTIFIVCNKLQLMIYALCIGKQTEHITTVNWQWRECIDLWCR